MSYYSDFKYGNRDAWFLKLYFDRWFKSMRGPVLDVGCAAGDFIAVKPEIIEGFDYDDDNLQKAREKGYKVRKIDIEAGEMRQLSVDTYEGVYASQIIEHLTDTLAFLTQIRRVLKSGGTAVILTPNIPHRLGAFWDDYTHKRPLTKKALKMAAYDAGFRDIRVYQDFRPMPGIGRFMRFFGLSHEDICRLQRFLRIPALSLILEVKK